MMEVITIIVQAIIKRRSKFFGNYLHNYDLKINFIIIYYSSIKNKF